MEREERDRGEKRDIEKGSVGETPRKRERERERVEDMLHIPEETQREEEDRRYLCT